MVGSVRKISFYSIWFFSLRKKAAVTLDTHSNRHIAKGMTNPKHTHVQLQTDVKWTQCQQLTAKN